MLRSHLFEELGTVSGGTTLFRRKEVCDLAALHDDEAGGQLEEEGYKLENLLGGAIAADVDENYE